MVDEAKRRGRLLSRGTSEEDEHAGIVVAGAAWNWGEHLRSVDMYSIVVDANATRLEREAVCGGGRVE